MQAVRGGAHSRDAARDGAKLTVEDLRRGGYEEAQRSPSTPIAVLQATAASASVSLLGPGPLAAPAGSLQQAPPQQPPLAAPEVQQQLPPPVPQAHFPAPATPSIFQPAFPPLFGPQAPQAGRCPRGRRLRHARDAAACPPAVRTG